MEKTSTTSFIILLLLASFFLFSSNKINAQEKNKESTESLKEKIEQLEKKIQKQQTEIDNLKKEIEKLKKNSPLLAVPELKDNDNFRKGKPFKFNGKMYYMVPLNSINDKNKNQKVK